MWNMCRVGDNGIVGDNFIHVTGFFWSSKDFKSWWIRDDPSAGIYNDGARSIKLWQFLISDAGSCLLHDVVVPEL